MNKLTLGFQQDHQQAQNLKSSISRVFMQGHQQLYKFLLFRRTMLSEEQALA